MDKITHQVRCEQWTSIINECLARGMNKTAFAELTSPALGKVPVSDSMMQPDFPESFLSWAILIPVPFLGRSTHFFIVKMTKGPFPRIRE